MMPKGSEKIRSERRDPVNSIKQHWMIGRDEETGEEICCLTWTGLSRLSRLPIPTLRKMTKQGLISPLPGRDHLFPQETLRRVAKIERLRAHLQLTLDGLEVVLQLLDRMEAMERELAKLKRISF